MTKLTFNPSKLYLTFCIGVEVSHANHVLRFRVHDYNVETPTAVIEAFCKDAVKECILENVIKGHRTPS